LVSDTVSIEVRSYRNVFALERRIYRIDSVRLNPGGVPMRGVLYGAGLALSIVMLASLPITGWLLGWLPWYARDLAVPAAGAALLTVIRVEGRSFHLAAYALLRHVFSARHRRGTLAIRSPGPGRRWRPPDLPLLVDGSDARLRRMRFSGPGAALVAVPHTCAPRRRAKRGGAGRLRLRALRAQQPPARARVLALPRGARVDVYPD
jgi:hypothetical protein